MVDPIPLHRRSKGPETGGLWHIKLAVAGDRVTSDDIEAAMVHLAAQSPFLTSIRYDEVHAEITYWDEADVLDDAAAMALRLWNDHRHDARLPDWRPVRLEVLDRDGFLDQHQGESVVSPTGDVRRF